MTRSENSRRARLNDTEETKTKRAKSGFRGGYNRGDNCKRGHLLEKVKWANGQTRVCKVCHSANNAYFNSKLPIEQRVY